MGKSHLPFDQAADGEQMELALTIVERQPRPDIAPGAVVFIPKRVAVRSGESEPTISVAQAGELLERSIPSIHRWSNEGLLLYKQARPGAPRRIVLSSAVEMRKRMDEER